MKKLICKILGHDKMPNIYISEVDWWCLRCGYEKYNIDEGFYIKSKPQNYNLCDCGGFNPAIVHKFWCPLNKTKYKGDGISLFSQAHPGTPDWEGQFKPSPESICPAEELKKEDKL